MKCKVGKTIIGLGMAIVLTAGMSTSAFASEANTTETNETKVSYSIDMDDSTLAGATHISSETYVENDRMITVDVYEQADGTIITDTLDRSAIAPLANEGSDVVTRVRKIGSWGTISITAGFSWYTKEPFSYVKCTYMKASHNLDKRITVSTWEKYYTSSYVSIGKANASVKYYMFDSLAPGVYQSGTFTISCTDEGTVSDNG